MTFFQGYLVGNGATDYLNFDGNSKVPFAHGMGLISDEMYEVKQYQILKKSFCSAKLNVYVLTKCLVGTLITYS